MKEVTLNRLHKLIHNCRTFLMRPERFSEIMKEHPLWSENGKLVENRRALWAALHNEIYHHNDHFGENRRRGGKHRWTR